MVNKDLVQENETNDSNNIVYYLKMYLNLSFINVSTLLYDQEILKNSEEQFQEFPPFMNNHKSSALSRIQSLVDSISDKIKIIYEDIFANNELSEDNKEIMLFKEFNSLSKSVAENIKNLYCASREKLNKQNTNSYFVSMYRKPVGKKDCNINKKVSLTPFKKLDLKSQQVPSKER